MAKKRHSKLKITIALTLAIILIVLAVLGWYMYTYHNDTFMEYYNILFNKEETDNSGNEGDKTPVIIEGELSIHFMMLGNKNNGDCIYIKAGDTYIIVDAGSTAGSVTTIQAYINDYVTDGVIEYVIVTHADADHIAGFGASTGIFDLYECETIIDFPRTNKTTQVYNRYVTKRNAEVEAGATHYTALECWNEENGAHRTWQLSDDVTMSILYQEFYENKSTDENNYSVCFLLTHGSRNFLFTGDLEKEGEESLAEENELPEVELFKAGHHGSRTSSNTVLLEKIKPEICVVHCVAGYREYPNTLHENIFPSQAFIDRISQYTDKVYIPTLGDPDFTDGEDYVPMNGNIVVVSGTEGVSVNCSENNTVLKDTEWFKSNRTCPQTWQAAA